MKYIKLPVIPKKCSEAYRFRIPDWASLVKGSAFDQAMHKAEPTYTRHTRRRRIARAPIWQISHHNPFTHFHKKVAIDWIVNFNILAAAHYGQQCWSCSGPFFFSRKRKPGGNPYRHGKNMQNSTQRIARDKDQTSSLPLIKCHFAPVFIWSFMLFIVPR